jgi:hypothetical protein
MATEEFVVPDMRSLAAVREHRFLTYLDASPPVGLVNRVAAYILNRYLLSEQKGGDVSIKRLKKARRFEIDFRSGTGPWRKSRAISLQSIADHLRVHRSFDSDAFDLPPLKCNWLDDTLGFSKKAPIPRSDGSEFAAFTVPTNFGEAFPVAPCIDREGVMWTSFQGEMLRNLVRLHRKQVEDSSGTAMFGGPWLNNLRMLLNESVSLVDITLHQLYFMAKYRGAERGWRYDETELGGRCGMRLSDKISWIGKITGRPLDDARDEWAGFVQLKAVRNHFSHFDPPCVAYTVEDICTWLNLISTVAALLWKIRAKLHAQLSRQLIEVLLLPRVEFVPLDPSAPRVPQPRDCGYGSVVWPE